MKSKFGLDSSRNMLSFLSQPLNCQTSNISRVMYSEVKRLMIRPTVKLMPKPFSWSLPTA